MSSVAKSIRLCVLYAIGAFWSFFVLLQAIRLAVTKRGKFFYKKNRTVAPACIEDNVYGEHGYTTVNGITLHYVVSGPSNAPLMVMLHGFPEFWYSWRHQIKEFNKTYRVVAVDLRGYGGSSKPSEVSAYELKNMVDDIVQLIQALGYSTCTLLGHDWGGALTWALAGNHPEVVSKVIVCNCPHMHAMQDNITWKQFLRSWYMFFVNMPYFPEWFFSTGDLKMLDNAFTSKGMGAQKGAFTQEDMEAFKFTFNSMWDFTGPMNYIRAAVRGLNRGRYYRQKVSVPVLLIWGTRDGALTKELAEHSRKYADNFTLEYVEGASHWVQQDEPQKVNQLIHTFLNSKDN